MNPEEKQASYGAGADKNPQMFADKKQESKKAKKTRKQQNKKTTF
ncbi:MAG: hypothetical protein AAB334_01800 [Patescibacteria group bacterium]